MPEETMRGADPVNDELEVGFNARFEAGWHRSELFGRIVLITVVAAAAAGFLGSGPLSHRTLSAPTGLLDVDYEPIARLDTPTMITLHIHPPPGDTVPRVAELHLTSNFVEPMGLQGSLPMSVTQGSEGRGLLMKLDVLPAQDALVRLKGRPTEVGPITLSAQIGADAPLSWTQYVLP